MPRLYHMPLGGQAPRTWSSEVWLDFGELDSTDFGELSRVELAEVSRAATNPSNFKTSERLA
jgi:hypothetical protein